MLRAYDSVSDGQRFDRRLTILLKGKDPRSEGVDRDVSRPAVIASSQTRDDTNGTRRVTRRPSWAFLTLGKWHMPTLWKTIVGKVGRP